MLEGEGRWKEGKCGREGVDWRRNWKEAKKRPQEEMERSLLRH